MMYEVEFIKVETGELHKQDIQAIDWRNAVSECFSLQHVLRERHGGNWKFLRLELVG